jgi:hypothetical protein
MDFRLFVESSMEQVHRGCADRGNMASAVLPKRQRTRACNRVAPRQSHWLQVFITAAGP